MKISQAMIVKNEEKNIAKALSWGKAIVAEQIVVDTGSTDRTVEIAEKMGAKVVFFPWQDDFAEAKNFAISQCQYPWIALLDADEYFDEKDAKKLPEILKKVDRESHLGGILTAWLHLNKEGRIGEGGSIIRLFRNRKDIRYRRAIHEQLKYENGDPFLVYDCTDSLSIFHTGYMDLKNTEKMRSDRNLLLIEKELSKNPEDFEMMVYLGNEYLLRNQFREAKRQYEKFLSYLPKNYSLYHSLIASGMVNHLHALEKLETEEKKDYSAEAFQVVREATKLLPEDGDFAFTLGKYLYGKERYQEAISYLQEALQKIEQYGAANQSQSLLGGLVYCYKILAFACLKEKDLQGAVRYSMAVLQGNPNDWESLRTLLYALWEGQTKPEEIVGFLSRFYRQDYSLLLAVAKEIGYESLLQYLVKQNEYT
jgi:glycosyltransferases involved in cell wall biogenesis